MSVRGRPWCEIVDYSLIEDFGCESVIPYWALPKYFQIIAWGYGNCFLLLSWLWYRRIIFCFSYSHKNYSPLPWIFLNFVCILPFPPPLILRFQMVPQLASSLAFTMTSRKAQARISSLEKVSLCYVLEPLLFPVMKHFPPPPPNSLASIICGLSCL